MSVKDKPHNKKIRKLERALRKGRLPRYLNLIHWLEDHGYADTTGQAKKLIEEDRVYSESHPVGKTTGTIPKDTINKISAFMPSKNATGEDMKIEVLQIHVPASLRPTLRVIDPKEA